jgi:hypothetical protein
MPHVLSLLPNKRHRSIILNLLVPIESASYGATTPLKQGRDPTLNGTLTPFDPDPRIRMAFPDRGTRHRPQIL